ncbi:MAG TPA: choice-of-anchor B family protein [Ignavibacteria bacterium]|nr:choice-of-anchor B family protein [Ignavibacteria bacterium]
MKKTILFLLIISFSVISKDSYSQLPNQNTYLLKNLNQHFTSTLYSAIWGYKAPDGREYALLGCPSGTAFIDVTDSANIHEVDFLTGLNSAWREMKTYSHYAYIVSEASNSKLQIVDLQYLPDSVSLVKTWGYTGYTKTHSISQSGHYLYLNGGNANSVGGITVLDVIDPVNPVKMGDWTTLYVHDCRVINDTIYAANINNGKVSIINALNKSSLNTVVTFTNLPGSGPHNTALSTDRKRLYVTDEIGTAPYLLKLWNIDNKSNPSYITSWQPTGITTAIVHNIETYGNYGIIAHYTAGIRIVDISNPNTINEVAWYDTYPTNNGESYNGCWGVYMFPSGKIIASDRQTGLYVIKTNFVITGTGNQTVNSVPDKFSLSQNYPNPFNPSTVIRYTIPSETQNLSSVKLKVYDVLGNEVAELVNEDQAGGDYEVNFEASKYGLSSGTFFYTLSADNFKETKKMLLLK